MANILAVIPARYGSSRLPGKPLTPIDGKPLVRHVYERARDSELFDRVVVATDDRRILDAVREFGGEAVMTGELPSGTDRVAEIARSSDADLVVNVQGDLPFVSRTLLEPPLERMIGSPDVEMGTVAVPISDSEQWVDPNVVKVVMDEEGFALYFSRAPIPAVREEADRATDHFGWQHVGLYVYRRDFLLRFAAWAPTRLERLERLEQLRALERGVRIYVGRASERVVEVDTLADIERAERYLRLH